MTEALGRMFGKEEAEKPVTPGTPRILLGLTTMVAVRAGNAPRYFSGKCLKQQATILK